MLRMAMGLGRLATTIACTIKQRDKTTVMAPGEQDHTHLHDRGVWKMIRR